MDKKKTDQIRAMLDAHIDADTIMKVLGVTKLDIVGFTEYEKEPEEKKQPEPSPVYTEKRTRRRRMMKVTMERFYQVKDLLCDGFTQKEIATKTGLGTTTISKISTSYDYQAFKALREKEGKEKAEKDREAREKYFENKEKAQTKASISPELVELRAINDMLQQIAETLRKTHRRGLFRK